MIQYICDICGNLTERYNEASIRPPIRFHNGNEGYVTALANFCIQAQDEKFHICKTCQADLLAKLILKLNAPNEPTN